MFITIVIIIGGGVVIVVERGLNSLSRNPKDKIKAIGEKLWRLGFISVGRGRSFTQVGRPPVQGAALGRGGELPVIGAAQTLAT